MRRMFAEIDADIYVLVDGDDTYDARAAPLLIRALIEGGNDLVSGKRNAEGRGSAYRVDYVSQILIEWYGPDDEADAVIRAIQQRASTGAAGDGSIFAQHVEEAVRIRTGERGLDAV